MPCFASALALRFLATYSTKAAIRPLTAQLRSFNGSSSRRPRRLKLYACKVLTRLDDVYQLKRLGISSLDLYIEKSLSWPGRQLGTNKCSSYYSKVMYTRMMLKWLCWIFSPRLPQESQNFTFFFYFFSHTFIDTYNIHLYYSLIYLFINCTTIIASWFSNTVFNQ